MMIWTLTVWFLVLAHDGSEQLRTMQMFYLSRADCIQAGFDWKRFEPSVEKFRCSTQVTVPEEV